ncbi:hypothetical protein DSO57_1022388 [Entomophthora muscae]|uniref:Uncharacterized protein n=1 Tax=Entomophthora muscae TaxID=34485 RepID=A0ACC2UPL0_9FUNG|nr:hypothetical protein DSO57_1022388 [Entomophthora muscae]
MALANSLDEGAFDKFEHQFVVQLVYLGFEASHLITEADPSLLQLVQLGTRLFGGRLLWLGRVACFGDGSLEYFD